MPECPNCADLELLVQDLKVKCKVSSKAEVAQLLTVAPRSWTIAKTSQEFGVSEYLVRKARSERDEEGILAKPSRKQGSRLPPDVEKSVTEFYQCDEVSRICPGKKDYVSVEVSGQKQQVQKRLLLCNLNELYQQFIVKSGMKIGISKFCDLRPKYCITVGASGTHSVCVCSIHQNFKLMLADLDKNLDYHKMMQKVVCDEISKQCMIHRCDHCPGTQPLHDFLQSMTEEDYDPDDQITFKQWMTTDRTTLITQQKSIEDFVDNLVEMADNLTTHHYVSKHQSAYLSAAKTSLRAGCCIIILDFAENFSFVVQDAAQGYHWDNSQATLHPFSVYFIQEGQL